MYPANCPFETTRSLISPTSSFWALVISKPTRLLLSTSVCCAVTNISVVVAGAAVFVSVEVAVCAMAGTDNNEATPSAIRTFFIYFSLLDARHKPQRQHQRRVPLSLRPQPRL